MKFLFFLFSIYITRAQASDTGYYTCELFNGRDPTLRRSFDLRVKGIILNLFLSFIIVYFSIYIYRSIYSFKISSINNYNHHHICMFDSSSTYFTYNYRSKIF